MKLPINNISAFARDVFAGKKRATAKRLINPQRDWLIGILIGLGILVGIMVWSAYMYVSNRSGNNIATDQDPAVVPAYRAAAVTQALDLFEQKQVMFDDLKSQTVAPVVIVDTDSSEAVDVATTTITSSTSSTVNTSTTTNSTESTVVIPAPESEPAPGPAEINLFETPTLSQ
jgi:hypothetical protein